MDKDVYLNSRRGKTLLKIKGIKTGENLLCAIDKIVLHNNGEVTIKYRSLKRLWVLMFNYAVLFVIALYIGRIDAYASNLITQSIVANSSVHTMDMNQSEHSGYLLINSRSRWITLEGDDNIAFSYEVCIDGELVLDIPKTNEDYRLDLFSLCTNGRHDVKLIVTCYHNESVAADSFTRDFVIYVE